jgi:ABC-type transport system involved in multi-copper enzyme maturation permease subunit
MQTNIKNNTGRISSKNHSWLSLWLIAQQELLKSFANPRGLFVTAVFTVIWILILLYPIRISAEAMTSPDSASLFMVVLSFLGLETLQDWLLSEFAIYWVVALYLFPTFSLVSAADQMISDRNRGGLRFLTLRCSRGQLFFGRFVGQILIQSVLICITLVITYSLFLFNNSQYWLEGLSLLPLIFFHILLVTAPFVALMSLLSITVDSVRMSTLIAFMILALGGLLINYFASYLPFLAMLEFWIPGGQIYSMAQSHPTIAWGALAHPLMQTFGFLLLGYAIFKRQEI